MNVPFVRRSSMNIIICCQEYWSSLQLYPQFPICSSYIISQNETIGRPWIFVPQWLVDCVCYILTPTCIHVVCLQIEKTDDASSAVFFSPIKNISVITRLKKTSAQLIVGLFSNKQEVPRQRKCSVEFLLVPCFSRV